MPEMNRVQETNKEIVREGWMLKRKRKRNQGFARRWLKLTEDGRLSYAVSAKSTARESCLINHAAISRSQSSLDFIIDTGSSIWRIRALSSNDFAKWHEAFRAFIKVANRSSMTLDRPSSAGGQQSADVDVRAILVAATKLSQPLDELKALESSMKAEPDHPKDEHSHTKLDKKLKTMFNKIGHSKEGSSKEKDNLSVETSSVSSSSSHSSQITQLSKLVAKISSQHAELLELLKESSRSSQSHHHKENLSESPTSSSPKSAQSALFASRGALGFSTARNSMDTYTDGDSIYHDAHADGAEYDIDSIRHARSGNGSDSEEELSAVAESEAEEEGDTSAHGDDDDDDDDASVKTAQSRHDEAGSQNVQRRTSLPAPEAGNDVSIFGMLRKNMGKDLSRISFPISFNEPLSALQGQAEMMEYASLLHKAAEAKDPIDRICLVAAFVVSGFSTAKYRGARKPFNPLLGETTEVFRPDKGLNFVAEKVCHHPPVLACWAQDPKGSWTINMDTGGKQKFYGKSLEYIPSGSRELRFEDSDAVYTWSLPSTFARNIMSGQKYIEYVGDFSIESSSGERVDLEVLEGSMWGGSGSRNKVQGTVYNANGNEESHMEGKWDEAFSRKSGNSSYEVLWRMTEPVSDPTKQYGFSAFAVELNEITSDIEASLPPTDSRLRPDQSMLERGQVDEAEEVKAKLEDRQRSRKSELDQIVPQYFEKSNGKWQYTGKYMELRKDKKWNDKLKIFDV